MEPFRTLTSIVASMPGNNIDTDIIFPARFLLLLEKAGVGKYAFYEKRFDTEGRPNPGFILNKEPFSSAKILLAGDNFGCGSSREQAVWTLADFGFRCVIAPRFGDIFYANCFKSGVLPIRLADDIVESLRKEAEAEGRFTVDLERQIIETDGGTVREFDIEPRRKTSLLNGWDETALILKQDGEAIAAFQKKQWASMPWLYADKETTRG